MTKQDKIIIIEDPPLSARKIHELLAGVVGLRQIYRAWDQGALRCTLIGKRKFARLSWVEEWIDGIRQEQEENIDSK